MRAVVLFPFLALLVGASRRSRERAEPSPTLAVDSGETPCRRSASSEASTFASAENSPRAHRVDSMDANEFLDDPPKRVSMAASPMSSTGTTQLSGGTTVSAPLSGRGSRSRLERDSHGGAQSDTESVSRNSSEYDANGSDYDDVAVAHHHYPGALAARAGPGAAAEIRCVVTASGTRRGWCMDWHWVYDLSVLAADGTRPRSVPQRRFSDFVKMHQVLTARNRFRAVPPLPPTDGLLLPVKKLVTYLAPHPSHVSRREAALNVFMSAVLAHPVLGKDHALRLFMDAGSDAFSAQCDNLVRQGDNGGMPILQSRVITVDEWPGVSAQSWANWLDAERWAREAISAASSHVSVLDAHLRTEHSAMQTDALTLEVTMLTPRPVSSEVVFVAPPQSEAQRLAGQCQRAAKVRREALHVLKCARDAATALHAKLLGLADMIEGAKKVFIDGWQAHTVAFANATAKLASSCGAHADAPAAIEAANRERTEALAGAALLLALRVRADKELAEELTYAASALSTFKTTFASILTDLNGLRATISN